MTSKILNTIVNSNENESTEVSDAPQSVSVIFGRPARLENRDILLEERVDANPYNKINRECDSTPGFDPKRD